MRWGIASAEATIVAHALSSEQISCFGSFIEEIIEGFHVFYEALFSNSVTKIKGFCSEFSYPGQFWVLCQN